MTEKISTIRNPLTIIAVFAGIAEVSGSVVLPFLDRDHQGPYVQFLIWFPTYLVTFFFLVLFFRHKVFYAPSDFRDDRFFMDLVNPATEKSRFKRINDEIEEEARANSRSVSPLGQSSDRTSQNERRKEIAEFRSRYLAAEEIVMGVLSKEIGCSFKRNIQFGSKETFYAFDAAFMQDGHLHAIEVKMIRHPRALIDRVG